MKTFRLIMNAVSLAALAILLLLPTSKYAWIEEVDPSFSANRFEDQSADSVITWVSLTVVILMVHAALLIWASSRRQKVVSTVVVAVAVVAAFLAIPLP